MPTSAMEIRSLINRYKKLGKMILKKIPCYEGKCSFLELLNEGCPKDCPFSVFNKDILNIASFLDS